MMRVVNPLNEFFSRVNVGFSGRAAKLSKTLCDDDHEYVSIVEIKFCACFNLISFNFFQLQVPGYMVFGTGQPTKEGFQARNMILSSLKNLIITLLPLLLIVGISMVTMVAGDPLPHLLRRGGSKEMPLDEHAPGEPDTHEEDQVDGDGGGGDQG